MFVVCRFVRNTLILIPKDLNAAIRAYPHNFAYFFDRGCLVWQRVVSRALQDLSCSLLMESGKSNVGAYFYRALCYVQCGKIDLANFDLQTGFPPSTISTASHILSESRILLVSNNADFA